MAVFSAIAAAVTASAISSGIIGTSLLAAQLVYGAAYLVSSFVGSVGLSAVSRKPKQASVTVEARDRALNVRQPVTARRIVYGQVKLGGPFLFLHSTDANAHLHFIIALAGHELAEIGAVYFNDEVVPVNLDGTVTGRYAGKAFVYKHLGEAGQAADAALIAAAPDKWTADHKLSGIAYLYVKLVWDNGLFGATGLPTVSAVCNGRKIYDPRTAATAWSSNAALCLADYVSDAKFGLGAAYAELDEPALIAAANACDEAVALSGGGTEARYACHGTIESDRTPKDNIQDLLTAMGGHLVLAGGKWGVFPAVYRPPTVTLTESDLRGGIRVQTRVSRRENFNAVKGVFVDPNSAWQPTDFPPVTNAAYLAEDGGERVWRDIELPFTVSAATAQRLAKIELERARQPVSVTMPCKLTAFRLGVPDVVMVSNARMGWAAKPFEVRGWTFAIVDDGQGNPGLGVDLNLRETASAVFDWNSGEEQILDASPNTNLPSAFTVAAPTGLALASGTPHLYMRLDGTVFSRIKASWTAPADAFVTSGGLIEIQHKRSADSVWQPSQFAGGADLAAFILDVQDGVAYDVRLRAVNGIGVESAWVQASNHVVVGKTEPPADVAGFTAAPNGALVVFRWQAVADLDVAGYTIRYGALAAAWAAMTELTQATRGTQITTAAVPPGTWDFAIRARDTWGNESAAEARHDLTVGNVNAVIAAPPQAPDWLGTKTDFVKHWTGVLVPETTLAAAALTNVELFEQFVPYPVALCIYEAAEIDLGFDASVRAFAPMAAALGRGVTAGIAATALELDYRLDAGSYDGFEPWGLGTIAARRVKARLKLQPALGNAYVSAFTPTIDAPNRDDERGQGVAVGSGGTAITFARRFFFPPNVQVTALGGAAVIGVADNVTATGFTARLFNTAGAGVAGAVNWQALGS